MGLAISTLMATPGRFPRSNRERAHDAMIELLERRGIQDRCVVAAMTFVPREPFVTRADMANAYADHPLDIGHGQTISQPTVTALMIQALQLQGSERVLEIGTGSGYSAAVLSQLAAHVYSVERDPDLAAMARARLAALGYDGITITCRDGSLGWPERAPYDAIIVAAAAPSVPQPLIDQLALGGRLVIPIGPREEQHLMRVTRTSAESFDVKDLGPVRFVPLVGALGWPEPVGP
jgi:protein-L-isoaspartate(D-aspartate) O-methyltransferase